MRKLRITLSKSNFECFYEVFQQYVQPARVPFITVPLPTDSENHLRVTDEILLQGIFPALYAHHTRYYMGYEEFSLNFLVPQHLALYRLLMRIMPRLQPHEAIILQAMSDSIHWVLTNGKSQPKPPKPPRKRR